MIGRLPARGLLAVLALGLAWAAADRARAQDEEEPVPAAEEEAPSDGAQDPPPDEPPLAEDGVEGAEATAGEPGGGYEPDQRGTIGPEPGPEPPETPPPTVDVQDVVREEAIDLGAGPALELRLTLGGGLTGLDAAGGHNLVRAHQQGGLGGVLGIGAAVRLGPLALGPSVSFGVHSRFLLTTAAVEVLVLPWPGALEPYARVAGGASFVSALGRALEAQSQAAILGFGLEVALGARWNLHRALFVGAELAGGWHHLTRGAVHGCGAECVDGALDLARSGESDALTLRVSLLAGARF